jgi:hypothetical protein
LTFSKLDITDLSFVQFRHDSISFFAESPGMLSESRIFIPMHRKHKETLPDNYLTNYKENKTRIMPNIGNAKNHLTF